MAAIVREYGVDPSWLIREDYCAATHHAVLNADEGVTPTALLTLAAPSQPLTPANAYELRLGLPVDLPQGNNPGEPGDPATLA